MMVDGTKREPSMGAQYQTPPSKKHAGGLSLTPTKAAQVEPEDVQEDENKEDSDTVGPSVLKVLLADAQAVRELQSCVLSVLILEKAHPVAASIEKASQDYRVVVQANKPEHGLGPPHIHRVVALMEQIVALTTEHKQEQQWIAETLQEIKTQPLAEGLTIAKVCRVRAMTSRQASRSL